MEETVNVYDNLLQDAKLACCMTSAAETVRLGLEALVRRGAYERLRLLRGSEPGAQDIPRREKRREKRKEA